MDQAFLSGLTPEKIKDLSINELNELCQLIREEILDTVSKNGGHLSSNLGIVELSVALEYVFNEPKDKIIFDVSHQTYTHKILTGRYDDFKNHFLKNGGLSGFADEKESIYDAIESGHSSTSLAVGLGLLEAKASGSNIGEVIAVIGDGSVSNGLSFEALNKLGELKNKKMIVIINDNDMSVSKNVGALAKRFNSIRVNKPLRILKKCFSKRFKFKMQTLFYKNKLFTSLGLKYFENIDGHNLKELIKYLNYAKDYPSSIVLHVKTIKGKGYTFAEEDTIGTYHSVKPFDLNEGVVLDDNKITFGKAFSNALVSLKQKETTSLIKVINPGMSFGCGLSSFIKAYPVDFIDVGIAEEEAVEIAVGITKANLLPIVSMYSTFFQRAYDEVLNDVARLSRHVVFLIDHAGIISQDGPTHQGIYDLAMLNSIPNILILSPVLSTDAISLLNYALYEESKPVVIRYPHEVSCFDLNYQNLLKIDYQKPYTILKASTSNTYVLTYGTLSLDVFNMLDQDFTLSNVGLININHLNEIDKSLFDELLKDNQKLNLVTYEEVIYNGSVTSILNNFIMENNLGGQVKVKSFTLPNTYLKVATKDEILEENKLTLKDLALYLQSIK